MSKLIRITLLIIGSIAIAVVFYLIVTTQQRKVDQVSMLTYQVNSLLAENVELQRRLVENNNEALLYTAALESTRTVNRIANYHVFGEILTLLAGICGVGFAPLVWMLWSYIYYRYYQPAICKVKKNNER